MFSLQTVSEWDTMHSFYGEMPKEGEEEELVLFVTSTTDLEVASHS